jgi:hypothetical protein
MLEGRVERTTDRGWGVCERALKLHLSRKGLSGKSQGQNRHREIRPSGIAGGPEEPWLCLYDLVRAPRLYPDPEEPIFSNV